MALQEYLKNHMEKKTELKIFLSNKTMLSGRISNFDDDCIILDKCLIYREQIISVVPA